MAMYDFGGGKDSLLSNYIEYHLASGEADNKNSSDGAMFGGNCSGKAAGSSTASDSSITWKTVVFVLFCLLWLYCEIKH